MQEGTAGVVQGAASNQRKTVLSLMGDQEKDAAQSPTHHFFGSAWVSEAAEQLRRTSVWLLCCEHLKRTLAAIGPPPIFRLLPNYANGVG